MKAKKIYILFLSLAYICCQEEDYLGKRCEEKDFSVSLDEANGQAGDYTLAHHKVASCATLYPYEGEEDDGEPRLCCYTKVKYKLEGEKYTRKVCQAVNPNNIDEEIQTTEYAVQLYYQSFYSHQGELKDIDVSIDCNSNFLKYSALLILIILL